MTIMSTGLGLILLRSLSLSSSSSLLVGRAASFAHGAVFENVVRVARYNVRLWYTSYILSARELPIFVSLVWDVLSFSRRHLLLRQDILSIVKSKLLSVAWSATKVVTGRKVQWSRVTKLLCLLAMPTCGTLTTSLSQTCGPTPPARLHLPSELLKIRVTAVKSPTLFGLTFQPTRLGGCFLAGRRTLPRLRCLSFSSYWDSHRVISFVRCGAYESVGFVGSDSTRYARTSCIRDEGSPQHPSS